MLATLLHGMQGTPYIYQGEELGMTNVAFPTIDDYRDIETLNMYRERTQAGYSGQTSCTLSRQEPRQRPHPMQWDATTNAGFTDGTPWLQVNPNYTAINAADEVADAGSVFHYYQALIHLRKQYPIFSEGDFTLLFADHPALFAYQRRLGDQVMTVLCNFYEEPLTLPATQWLPPRWIPCCWATMSTPRMPRLRPYGGTYLSEQALNNLGIHKKAARPEENFRPGGCLLLNNGAKSGLCRCAGPPGNKQGAGLDGLAAGDQPTIAVRRVCPAVRGSKDTAVICGVQSSRASPSYSEAIRMSLGTFRPIWRTVFSASMATWSSMHSRQSALRAAACWMASMRRSSVSNSKKSRVSSILQRLCSCAWRKPSRRV